MASDINIIIMVWWLTSALPASPSGSKWKLEGAE
jgi:hypothetical protein